VPNDHIPEGMYIPDVLIKKYPPTNNYGNPTTKVNLGFESESQIIVNSKLLFTSNADTVITFDLPYSTNMIERNELYLSGIITNPQSWPIQIDDSFQSLILALSIYDGNGTLIETIPDYPLFAMLHSDQNYSRDERIKRRVDEGYGTNTFVIHSLI
jgi:hypothetical protein